MADVTVAAGEVSSGVVNLLAGAVSTVTIEWMPDEIEPVNLPESTALVWYTLDGSTPTVGGRNCYPLPIGAADARRPSRRSGVTTTEVKLICSAAASVVVTLG